MMYYHEVALADRSFPVPCDECGGPVESFKEKTGGVVHHVDENPENNDSSNLMILHRGCHAKVHLSGSKSELHIEALRLANKSSSDEVRAKIAASLRGVHHTEERRRNQSAAQRRRFNEQGVSTDTRAALSRSLTGRVVSTETREKLSAALRGQTRPTTRLKSPCLDCGREYNSIWMSRHKKEGKCL